MPITVTLSREEAQLVKDALGVAVRTHAFVLTSTLKTVDTVMVKINVALGDVSPSSN